MHYDPIIDGSSSPGTAGVRDILNPFSGETVGTVSYAGDSQMERAVLCAHEAFQQTRLQASHERSAILERAAHGIEHRKEEFAQLICAESGKPISYARIEVDRAIFTFRSAANAASHVREGKVLDMAVAPNGVNRRGMYQYFPIGVVAAITPFNFPLNLVAHKVAPAMASGNTIVLKPAPQTPLTSFLLAEVLRDAGLREGVLNVVPCENSVAESLVQHDLVRMVSFTGSAAVGWRMKSIVRRAKVTLELGGNGFAIVDEIVDIEALTKSLTYAAFNYAGQVCIGLQNLLVQRALYPEVLARMIATSKDAKVGDPKNSDTLVGPMIGEAPVTKVEAWIAEAISSGATRQTGERKSPNWITPTVLTDVPLDANLWQEEAFAPILNLMPYDGFDDALRIVNGSKYGLQASLFSNNSKKIRHAYETLETGALIVNDTNNFRLDTMPYGGVKESGFGREGLLYAIREMSEMRLLVETI